ncbi:MAG: hypothetical protein WDN28_29380 [Chthoniobacter sp.]
MRDKIEYLARHGDEYDVLFLGSSRVHCQIMPAVFDRIAGRKWRPRKVLQCRAQWHARAGGRLLAGGDSPPPAPPSALDLRGNLTSRDRPGPRGYERFAYWHDTARLLLVVQRLRGQAMENEARLPREVAATFSARYAIWSETIGSSAGTPGAG